MNRRLHHFCVLATCVSIVMTGCSPSRPFYFFEDGDLSHYKGVATELEYPDVETSRLLEVENAESPFSLSDSETREMWDLPLEEAVKLALANSKVMRSLGAAVQNDLNPAGPTVAPETLTSRQALAVPTVYQPALADTDPRFGTEAALSRFDTQFTTGIFWEKNDRANSQAFGPLLPAIFEQDLGTFQAQLAKTAATGTQFFVRNNTVYNWNNSPANVFPSFWNTDLETEFRHPLLQGSGVDFNRIKGPNNVTGINASPNSLINDGVYAGVTIARINTDIALADFEAGVRNLVADVETAYWDLYTQYRRLDAGLQGRDSALQTWRLTYAKLLAGTLGGEAAAEAQAREQYFIFRGQVETALSQLYTKENRLRYLMGLTATDGRLIRPIDEPTTARVHFDWQQSHTEALARSVELRQQRWRIKQRELELVAAKNYLLPRLDAVAMYRWRGFGDQLLNSQSQDAMFDNAWQNLLDGDFQEWRMGVELNVPIGFRQQLSAVRNSQLQLARERAVLEDQELELSHQLSNAIRDLDRHYAVSQTNFNRRVAAQRQVEAFQTIWDVGGSAGQNRDVLSLLLDAQRRLAEAESDYYTSLANYNRTIALVHYRKNSLLEYNGVMLAEGPWASKAYYDAHRRARQRDAGLFINYGFTRPKVFSQGPIGQDTGLHQDLWREGVAPGFEAQPQETGEPIPAPMPDPMTNRSQPSSISVSAAQGGETPETVGPALSLPSAAVERAERQGVVKPASAQAPQASSAPVARAIVASEAPVLRLVQPASHDEPAMPPSSTWNTVTRATAPQSAASAPAAANNAGWKSPGR